MKRRVLIVGAGASGMVAAIHAARAGAEVILLEHKEKAGKKLLSTGNGRCNMTNLDQKAEYYRCSFPDFPMHVLEQFSVKDTLDFFQGLGILPKNRNGYLYPNSDQAVSVREALLQELDQLSVRVQYQCQTESATKQGKTFILSSNQGTWKGDALILAAGSMAAPITGSDGSGYQLAAMFGHRMVTPLPALVPLRCKEKHYKRLAGVRTDAKVSLFADGKFLADDCGQLQLTDYGISGIPVFQISRYASVALHRKQQVMAFINFLPGMNPKDVKSMLEKRLEQVGTRTAKQWMNGLFNNKLSEILLKLSGISEDQEAYRITEAQKERLLKHITAYETKVVAVNSFDSAQVCCGGVDVKQVDEETLESRLVKDLYFCGEILDVDGICGGYNLQWAWSSGAVAGKSASKNIHGEDRKTTIRAKDCLVRPSRKKISQHSVRKDNT